MHRCFCGYAYSPFHTFLLFLFFRSLDGNYFTMLHKFFGIIVTCECYGKESVHQKGVINTLVISVLFDLISYGLNMDNSKNSLRMEPSSCYS
jgi:hypothetical protein